MRFEMIFNNNVKFKHILKEHSVNGKLFKNMIINRIKKGIGKLLILNLLIMKRLALLTMSFLLVAGVAFGQPRKTEKPMVKGTNEETQTKMVPLKKLEGNVVSELAKSNFNMDFKNVSDAQWKRTENYDEVSFTMNGAKMKAFYGDDGVLVGTTQRKTFADISPVAQKEIKEKYAGYTIGPVIFFDDNAASDTDMILWATQFNDEDLYFVELTKGTEKIIVKVNEENEVSFFKKLS